MRAVALAITGLLAVAGMTSPAWADGHGHRGSSHAIVRGGHWGGGHWSGGHWGWTGAGRHGWGNWRGGHYGGPYWGHGWRYGGYSWGNWGHHHRYYYPGYGFGFSGVFGYAPSYYAAPAPTYYVAPPAYYVAPPAYYAPPIYSGGGLNIGLGLNINR